MNQDTKELVVAVAGEFLTFSLRAMFMYKRMQLLMGMTPEEVEAKYQATKAEFEKRPPEALEALIPDA